MNRTVTVRAEGDGLGGKFVTGYVLDTADAISCLLSSVNAMVPSFG